MSGGSSPLKNMTRLGSNKFFADWGMSTWGRLEKQPQGWQTVQPVIVACSLRFGQLYCVMYCNPAVGYAIHMRVILCVYIYIYIYMYTHTHTHLSLSLSFSLSLYIYIYIYSFVYTCTVCYSSVGSVLNYNNVLP